jgi:serine/threonine-protein kinase
VAERLRREAKAAAKIKGEHVVRVFDVGELEGAPFLVMEYVEGMNLAELIAAEGPQPPAAAVDYVLQACDALAQAHAAGIVHRDVKPSNLFVTARPDGQPLVKVLDFGISKITGAEKVVTLAKSRLGSPLYMSPEQVMSSRDVDARADIWSVGVVLYELLTGALPFVGDTVADVCARICTAAAPSLRKLRAEVPEGLERVVLRCLEKNPARRYATLPELVVALRQFAIRPSGGGSERPAAAIRAARDGDGDGTLFIPRRPPGSARPRRAIALAGIGVVAVAAAAAGVMSRRGGSPTHPASPVPVLARPAPPRVVEPSPPAPLPAGTEEATAHATAAPLPGPSAAPEGDPPAAPEPGPSPAPIPPPSHRSPARLGPKVGLAARAAVDRTTARAAPTAGAQDAPPALPSDRK